MGMSTFSLTAPHLTVPPETSAAPMSPPMSACEDDDGSPKYQVMRFHAIAPTRAAKTTTSPCVSVGGAMMSAMVLATFVDTRAPTRFMAAAIARATRGVNARVDTAVAIALAASWNPLVKSKKRAMATMRMTAARSKA